MRFPSGRTACLIEDASELKLRDDQLTQLKAVDDDLGPQLAALDGALRTPDPVRASSREDKPRGLGFRAGGVGNGMGGRTGAFPGPTGAPDDGGPRSGYISGETITEVNQRRAHEVRDALRRAFGVLEAAQQAIARRVLTDHAVDPDTGEIRGEPGAQPPLQLQPGVQPGN